MALDIMQLIGGIVFSIGVVLVFCYLLGDVDSQKSDFQGRFDVKLTSEEKEWERIERSSAFLRLEQQKLNPQYTRRSSNPQFAGRKRPIPGVAHSIARISGERIKETGTVRALRGGEFIGNRMRFKVKVLNETSFIISDVTVFLISYPKEALRLADKDNDTVFSKIEPGGFRSPSFDFLPTQDCVRGEIIAGVSYIDERGNPHVLNTKPFIIRSVCDLLLPERIDANEFVLKLKDLHCGELVVKVDSWAPEEMHERALRIMEDANFYEVSSNLEVKEGIVFAEIHGFAKGKYTGKSIAVEILISGPTDIKGANCTLKVSGEDEAMILPAIDDLRERLSAWLCPLCGSPLTLENVEDLKDGKAIVCPFCNVPIGR